MWDSVKLSSPFKVFPQFCLTKWQHEQTWLSNTGDTNLCRPSHKPYCFSDLKTKIGKQFLNYLPASVASRELANLTERKYPHTPVYGVKEFVCLSVCLSVRLWQTLTPIFSGLAEQNGLKKIYKIYCKKWPPIKLNSQGSEPQKNSKSSRFGPFGRNRQF